MTLAIDGLAAETSPWNKWSIAPFAGTLEESCQKAPQAINGFAMPSPVKEHFKSALGTACKGGTEVWLTPGTMLEQMWSGKSGKKLPYLMNKKSVGELPVILSPDGRKYRKGSVAETAKALSWTFVHEGKTYILYLPTVCFNWSWTYGQPPLLALECATVEYTVEPGDEIRFAVLAEKRLSASACWQLCDGEDCGAPPSPCDTCDWIGPKSVIPDGFEPLHTGKYTAKSPVQTLRFPVEVRVNYIALCDEREGFGASDSWIIRPDAWSGVVSVVPYDGQEWPVWGKVDWPKTTKVVN